MADRQKRRRTDSPPLLDDMFQQSSSTKSCAMESFASLSQVDFQRDTYVDLKAIPESTNFLDFYESFSQSCNECSSPCIVSTNKINRKSA